MLKLSIHKSDVVAALVTHLVDRVSFAADQATLTITDQAARVNCLGWLSELEIEFELEEQRINIDLTATDYEFVVTAA